MTTITPTIEHALEIKRLCSFGIPAGLGEPEEGRMCIEAIVAKACGLPHQDKNLECVGIEVAKAKIVLNDHNEWGSNEARAEGMKRAGVAQLGSNQIDQELFKETFKLKMFRLLFPIYLSKWPESDKKKKFSKRKVTNYAESIQLVKDAYGYGYDYAYDYDYSYSYAYAYAYAYAYGYAYDYDYDYGYAYAYDYGYKNSIPLTTFANLIVETLLELNSPGCQFLHIFDND